MPVTSPRFSKRRSYLERSRPSGKPRRRRRRRGSPADHAEDHPVPGIVASFARRDEGSRRALQTSARDHAGLPPRSTASRLWRRFAALALECIHHAEAAQRAEELMVADERLRSPGCSSSLSHDPRTPLTTLVGLLTRSLNGAGHFLADAADCRGYPDQAAMAASDPGSTWLKAPAPHCAARATLRGRLPLQVCDLVENVAPDRYGRSTWRRPVDTLIFFDAVTSSGPLQFVDIRNLACAAGGIFVIWLCPQI